MHHTVTYIWFRIIQFNFNCITQAASWWFALKKVTDLPILNNQYHDCWWPGDTRKLGITRYGIDLVPTEYCFARLQGKSKFKYLWFWNTTYSVINWIVLKKQSFSLNFDNVFNPLSMKYTKFKPILIPLYNHSACKGLNEMFLTCTDEERSTWKITKDMLVTSL